MLFFHSGKVLFILFWRHEHYLQLQRELGSSIGISSWCLITISEAPFVQIIYRLVITDSTHLRTVTINPCLDGSQSPSQCLVDALQQSIQYGYFDVVVVVLPKPLFTFHLVLSTNRSSACILYKPLTSSPSTSLPLYHPSSLLLLVFWHS